MALVVMAMLHGKTKPACITGWIEGAGQEDLAAAGGARAGADGGRAAPCGQTVTGLLGMIGAHCPRRMPSPAIPRMTRVKGRC
jgi:hypothetical protein